MYSGLPYSRLVSFNDGPPLGTVVWVARDITGTQLATGTITPTTGAVSTVITVPAQYNTLGVNDPLRVTRDLSWSYTTTGGARAGRERYFVEGVIPFPVSEASVRNMLGAPDHNLPDAEIDLVSAYWRMQTDATAALLLTFEQTDGVDAAIIARGIEAMAALEVLPTMPLRMALKEGSATDSYTRFDTDWEKIEANLLQTVHAALAVVSGEAAFNPGSIFQLTQPVDRFNPTG
jgi:hypothetical protein